MKRDLLLVIVYGFLWCVCKVRNDLIFKNLRISSLKLVDNVITSVFSWVKHKGHFDACNWVEWICSPLNIM